MKTGFLARWWLPVLVGCATILTALPARVGADDPVHSLRALEQRALLAKALTERVAELNERNARLEDQLRQADERIAELERGLEALRGEQRKIQSELSAREAELASRDRLLSILRSGAFEYYEVQEGDTLERIAANPMVYGDASREVWLRKANRLDADAPLTVGSVLIVPRFPEGVGYDL